MAVTLDLSREKTPLVMRGSLSLIAKSHTLRCDAKQAERRFEEFEAFISSIDHFCLGDFIPNSFSKGSQPNYNESLEPDGVPVISTIVIQQLGIRTELCRYVTSEDFDALDESRKPRKGDVLLTMDGGPSIGKPVLFDMDDDYANDSHVAILRPEGLDPRYLVYLLASPIGQVQFQRAESGASGQTAVTEDDVRRFRFPVISDEKIQYVVSQLDSGRCEIAELLAKLRDKEHQAWAAFHEAQITGARRL
jgi:hypothetical protein